MLKIPIKHMCLTQTLVMVIILVTLVILFLLMGLTTSMWKTCPMVETETTMTFIY